MLEGLHMVQTVASSKKPPARPSARPTAARLGALRALMKERGIDALVVRSTDKYLNEYVPSDESTREWITGFSGSMGDALITGDRAILVVDGRYTLQAAQESPEFLAHTTPLGTSIEQGWLKLLAELPAQGVKTLGVETERVPHSLKDTLDKRALELGLTVMPTAPSLIEVLRAKEGIEDAAPSGEVWAIDARLSGRTVKERLTIAHALFDARKVDAQLVVALDEIAWITNLRGTHFPFQATFRSTALVTRTQVFVVMPVGVPRPSAEHGVVFVDDIAAALHKLGASPRIAFDPRGTPAAIASELKGAGAELVEIDSPFSMARTQKTDAELRHMVAAFERADDVVSGVQREVNAAIAKGARITEADVARLTEQRFKDSGAFGLSFKVISAAGKNGAVIHYSTPDEKRRLKAGELFLLDTGAYYEGGYATDLTRTFLLGGPKQKATAEQRRLFTLVLKGAIAGMSARLPKGVVGEQLDTLVRAPLWAAGLDYGHGTGHGVGVNVHESPPRISIGSRVPVETGQVFSIEPGVYLPDWGGVRIENLCTLVEDTAPVRKGVPRSFVRVKPLTFSPMDARLIEPKLLTPYEKKFLAWFRAQQRTKAKHRTLPPLA